MQISKSQLKKNLGYISVVLLLVYSGRDFSDALIQATAHVAKRSERIDQVVDESQQPRYATRD